MNPTNKRPSRTQSLAQKVKQSKQPAPAFKPVVAQLKKGPTAQSTSRPVAPPVYRPQPVPKALQTKLSLPQTRQVGQMSGQRSNAPVSLAKSATARPVAPQVYKPQPVARALQRKTVVAQRPLHPTTSVASPHAAPRPAGMAVQVLQMSKPAGAAAGGGGKGAPVEKKKPAPKAEAKVAGGGGGGGGEVEEPELSNEDLMQFLDSSAEEIAFMNASEKARLKKLRGLRNVELKQQDEDEAALASCREALRCVSWEYGEETYHINVYLGTYHVTKECSPKEHYFFKGTGYGIEDAQPKPKERGRISGTSKVFSQLPVDVQNFIKKHWKSLLM